MKTVFVAATAGLFLVAVNPTVRLLAQDKDFATLVKRLQEAKPQFAERHKKLLAER